MAVVSSTTLRVMESKVNDESLLIAAMGWLKYPRFCLAARSDCRLFQPGEVITSFLGQVLLLFPDVSGRVGPGLWFRRVAPLRPDVAEERERVWPIPERLGFARRSPRRILNGDWKF